MDTDHWTFLTQQEAVDAIGLDFQQYGPQPELFEQLASLVLAEGVVVISQGKHAGPWMKKNGKKPMEKLEISRLGELILEELNAASRLTEELARICSLVFQVRAVAGKERQGRSGGIWIKNDMEHFVCVQCGQCCRSLCFEDRCFERDVRRWERCGRNDILARVRVLDALPWHSFLSALAQASP